MSERRTEGIDDAALMAEVARGDTVAFERLVERHQALVIGTVGRMLGSNSEVEDVAQQVFIRVWKGASRYRPTAKFTTWLLTITRNLVSMKPGAENAILVTPSTFMKARRRWP